MDATAHAATEVGCDPGTAFAVFTDHIGQWWKGSGHWMDPERAIDLRFVHEPERRLVEIYDDATQDGFTLGQVTVWEPGHRVSFGWRHPDWPPDAGTDVHVRFEPTTSGTRVELEHRGWEHVPPPQSDHGPAWAPIYSEGWSALLGRYAQAAESRRR
jgi:uncharacterized protein YndB with AHSA1/START domain